MASPLGEAIIKLSLNADQLNAELKGVSGQIEGFVTSAKTAFVGLGAALVGAQIGTKLVQATTAAFKFGDETLRMAQRIGVTSDALQELQHVARETGVPLQVLETGVEHLNRVFADAAQGNVQAREALARVNLSWQDASGQIRNAANSLGDLADNFNLLPAAERNQRAVQLFTRGGQEMINFLGVGSAQLAALRDEAHKLGLVMTSENLKALKDTNDAFQKAAAIIENEFRKAVVALAPAFKTTADGIAAVTQAISGMIGKVRDFLDNPNVQKFLWTPNQWLGMPTPLTEWEVTAHQQPRPPTAPPIPTQEQIAAARQQAQRAADAIRRQAAQAQAELPGGPEGDIESIQRQITDTSRLLDVELKRIATEQGIAKAVGDTAQVTKLSADADHLRAQAFIDLTNLGVKLRDALMAKATEEAKSDAQAAESNRTDQESFDIGKKNIEQMKEETRLQEKLIQLHQLASAAFIPPTIVDEPLARYSDAIADLNVNLKYFGQTSDLTRQELTATEAAMRALARTGRDTSDEFQRLANRAEELRRFMDLKDLIRDVFGGFANAISTSVTGIILGTTTIAKAFQNMAQSIVASIVNNIIQRGINKLIDALLQFVDLTAQYGLSQALGVTFGSRQVAAGSAAGIYPTTTYGNIAEIPTFQHGGVVHRPTLALVGEAGPEAIVPLGGLNRGETTINVYNQAPNTDVTAKSKTTPDGRVIHDIVVREVKRLIGTGEFDPIMAPYALRRVPTQR